MHASQQESLSLPMRPIFGHPQTPNFREGNEAVLSNHHE